MKIVKIRAWEENFNLSRPYTIAFRSIFEVQNIFIEIESDNGLIGHGCGSPEHHVTGETFSMCLAALNESLFTKLKAFDFAAQWTQVQAMLQTELANTPAARAAVDIALHDLHAKAARMPLYAWLGGQNRRLETSITIGIKPLAEVLSEADEYLQRGFKVIKLKLGKDLESDIERTLCLRERVGSDIRIRVDLNQGYTLLQLKSYFDRTSNAQIEFLEQPLHTTLFDQVATLSKARKLQIAADESLLTPNDAVNLAAHDLCGIFNIKLMKCGGIFPALAIANTAATHKIDLMWGCMDESRISIAAALHAAFACQNTQYLDLDGHLDLARDLFVGGFELNDGFMQATSTPGLGCHFS